MIGRSNKPLLGKRTFSSSLGSSFRNNNSAGAVNRSGNHGGDVGPSTPTMADNGDWDFLDLGSSVSNDEEQCHKFLREIQEIDAITQSNKMSMETEKRTEAQLKKDKTHAVNEMYKCAQEAREKVEAAQVHKCQREQHEKSLRNDLVQPVFGIEGTEASQKCTVQEFLRLRQEDRDGMIATLRTHADSLAEVKAKTKVLKEKIAAIQKMTMEEQLVEKLAQKQQEVEQLKKDFEEEERRRSTLQGAIQQAQAQEAKYALEISNQEKLLADTKTKNAADQAERQKRLDALMEEVRGQKSLELLETELNEVKREHDQVGIDLDEYKKLCNQQDATRKESKLVRAEMAELEKEQENRTAELAKAKAEVEAARKDLEEARAKLKAAQEQSDANDRYQADTVEQAQAELADLVKEKEALNKTIDDMTNEFEASEAKWSEDKQNLLKESEKADIEFVELTNKNQELSRKRRKLEQDIHEKRTAFQNDIEQTEKETADIEAKLEAEQARLNELKVERKLKEEAEFKRAGYARHLKILQYAVQAIEKSKKEAQEFLAKAVDEDSSDDHDIFDSKGRLEPKSVLELSAKKDKQEILAKDVDEDSSDDDHIFTKQPTNGKRRRKSVLELAGDKF